MPTSRPWQNNDTSSHDDYFRLHFRYCRLVLYAEQTLEVEIRQTPFGGFSATMTLGSGGMGLAAPSS